MEHLGERRAGVTDEGDRAGHAPPARSVGRPRLTVGAAAGPAERDADVTARRVAGSLGTGVPAAPAATRIRRSSVIAASRDEPVDADTDLRIRRAQGRGTQLPAGVREPMEAAFDRDLGSVRVHADAESHELNRRISARAFTLGDDVFLGRGTSVTDTGTLAHELAHVTQQGGRIERIHRLIGFEYEIGGWQTIEVDDPSDLVALASPVPVAPGYMAEVRRREAHWRKMAKGTVLAEAGDVEVTADDMQSYSDVELRTKALDETAGNHVRATAQQLADAASHATNGLKARYRRSFAPPTPHHLLASELGMTVKAPAAFLMPTLSNGEKMDTKGKVQATTGLRLDRLPDLLRNIFADPAEGMTERGRRKAGRLELAGFDQDTAPVVGPIMQTMGAAPGKATAALTAYTTGHAKAPAVSPELTGLLALLIAYMDMAKNGLVRSYAKTIAPVMARTDFATMFTMLSPAERDYYAAKSGRNFSDLLIAAGYTKAELDQAVYSAGVNQSQEPNEWYRDLKRKDWLRAIPSKAPKAGKPDKPGKDKLTPANYPTKRGRAEIEGLGSYAARTDDVDLGGGQTLKVPILELRSLPDMEGAQFVDFAEKLARLVTFLNAGQNKTYGET